jgi:hypothetical protein
MKYLYKKLKPYGDLMKSVWRRRRRIQTNNGSPDFKISHA